MTEAETGTLRLKHAFLYARQGWRRRLDLYLPGPWSGSLPIHCWAIEHGDKLLLVDTGETAPALCDSPVSLERMERQTIFEALERASGHHQKAAELLGISRRTLSRRLKVYGTHKTMETSVA